MRNVIVGVGALEVEEVLDVIVEDGVVVVLLAS